MQLSALLRVTHLLPPQSLLPEEEEPLSPVHQMEVELPEEKHLSRIQEEVALQMVVAKFMVWYFDAHKKRMLSTDDLKSITPALKMEVAIDVLFRLDLARKKRVPSASELDLIIRLKSYLEEEEEEVSKGAARGGEMQAVHPKLHRCSEVLLWDFDPMLVEVEACLTKRPEKEEEEEHRCSEVPLWDFDPMLVEVEACLSKRPQEEEGEEHRCSEVPLWDFDPMLVEVEACLSKRPQEEEEEEEFLSLSSIKEAALKIMFRLDLAREMRVLSVDELDLYDDMKSLLPRIEAEIGEDNANGVDAIEEVEAKEDTVDGADGVEEEEEEDPLLLALQKEVALQTAVAKFMVFYFDAHEMRMLSTDEVKSISPALKMEVAIEVLFQLDLARKKRILSSNELYLIIHLKSQLPCLEAEIGEVNAHGEDVEEADVEEEEALSPSRMMQAALKIIFRLDLAREMRILSVDELDLYDDMKSLLPLLEAEIGEDNADGLDVVEEEKAKEEDNADEVDAVEEEEEEEEEPLSPALRKEVAIEILFRFDLARKERTLSAGELDLISFVKTQLVRLEAEIGEVDDDDEEEEEGEEEPLSPALEMEAALKVMFRLDLVREMRTLSADELDLYDDMKSLLPRLEAEIRVVATAPSIALEDPPSCQLHAPSIALAGANEVSSSMVPGASTCIKLSSELQLTERSIVITNAELSTPGPEATPSLPKSSAEPEPAAEDDEITEALYRHSVRCHRLQIFRDICPE